MKFIKQAFVEFTKFLYEMTTSARFCLSYEHLSAGSVNFHAKLKIHSTWGSTDLDEIYTVCRLYRVYSIPKIFLRTIT